ncbi:hypothetical protein [Listeria sp. PSOL-1]|uniref:hypothetical protein n=1 Tax=Listeria sp. PSOL-1 TaxID=1844999 RepID=UPI0013D68715|nr:hypothetical protein [Listeria sp. PSOL-1]
MKKLSIILLFVIMCLISFICKANNVNAYEDQVITKARIQTKTFNELSEEEKNFFEKEGFNTNNEYYAAISIETPINSISTRRINVVTCIASTKKINATTGYTTYILTASRAGFLDLNTRLYYGETYRNSLVTPYNAPKIYARGIYFNYTSKKKYLPCRVTTQYYTSMGTGTVSSKAGGVTLGR